jgi:hypothetical protein
MKTIFFCILIVVNLASALGANFTGFTLQSASLKRFGLQGDFVSLGRCEKGFFDLGRIEQLHSAESEEIKQINMPIISFSGHQLNSGQLNFNPSLGAVQEKDFNPSLVQYTIHKPLQNAGRDMEVVQRWQVYHLWQCVFGIWLGPRFRVSKVVILLKKNKGGNAIGHKCRNSQCSVAVSC